MRDRRQSRNRLAVLCLLLWGSGSLLLSARADTIVLRSGKRIEGVEIVTARWDFVQYKEGSRSGSRRGDEVEAIERDSLNLRDLRQAARAGVYQKVVTEAGKLSSAAADWEKNEALYLKGEALLQLGKHKEAMTAFQAFIDQSKDAKDWWEPHAVYGKGQAALQRGQPKTAELSFKDLEAYGRNWSEKATLGRGEAALVGKDYLKARQEFTKVRSQTRNPALKQRASVLYAKTLVRQGQHRQAIGDLEKNFFAAAPKAGEQIYTLSRGEATFLMGEAFLEQGGKENFEQAEIWFLKTAALYQHYSQIYRDACKRLAELYGPGKLDRKERADEWRQRLARAGGTAE